MPAFPEHRPDIPAGYELVEVGAYIDRAGLHPDAFLVPHPKSRSWWDGRPHGGFARGERPLGKGSWERIYVLRRIETDT